MAVSDTAEEGKLSGEHGPAGILFGGGSLRHEMGRDHGGVLCDYISTVVIIPFRSALDPEWDHRRLGGEGVSIIGAALQRQKERRK